MKKYFCMKNNLLTSNGRMLSKQILKLIAVVVCLLLAPGHSFALPEGFLITEIAGNSGTNTFQYYDWAALNENGDLCYRGANTTSSAIVKATSTERTLVASTDDVSGLFDAFTTGICSINDSGDIAFDACRNCQAIPPSAPMSNPNPPTGPLPVEYGVYRRTDSGILVVIQESGTGDTAFKQVALPTINNSSTVSFSGELNNDVQGIWTKNGATLTNSFNSEGFLAELGGAFLNDNGQITFGAKEDGATQPEGIYGPSANPIIGNFNGFAKTSLPVINSNGDIVTLAQRFASSPDLTPENGVYINGAPFILNTGDFDRVEISSFQAVSSNDLGDVVFPAIKANGNRAAFMAAAGRLLVLLEQGEIIPGHSSPVSFITVGREAINNQRQVALAVVLQDGTELILRLDPNNLIFSEDLCPQDNTKSDPGTCGCGVSDADANSDGVLNCLVTGTVDQYARELGTLVRKLKNVSSSASKSKKKAAAKVIKDSKKASARLYNFIKGSQAQVKLNNSKKKVLQLASTIKRNVALAVKTSDSKFAKNKKTAISSINQLLKLLKLN